MLCVLPLATPARRMQDVQDMTCERACHDLFSMTKQPEEYCTTNFQMTCEENCLAVNPVGSMCNPGSVEQCRVGCSYDALHASDANHDAWNQCFAWCDSIGGNPQTPTPPASLPPPPLPPADKEENAASASGTTSWAAVMLAAVASLAVWNTNK